MKYLLTSAGIQNSSIHNALLALLGKPVAEASALCIPTAIYPFPGGPSRAYGFVSGTAPNPVCELGWKSLGIPELTALPSIETAYWTADVRKADALLVWEVMFGTSTAGCRRLGWPTCYRRSRPSILAGR